MGAGVVLAAAVIAGSVALAGFGVDSLIEIGASAVVIWQLREVAPVSEELALRLIGGAFVALSVYLGAYAAYALATHAEPAGSPFGMGWLAATVVAMVVLGVGKARTGVALRHPVLRAEARVTLVDAALAAAVLVGIAADTILGWWWADPVAGLVIVAYSITEVWSVFGPGGWDSGGAASGREGDMLAH